MKPHQNAAAGQGRFRSLQVLSNEVNQRDCGDLEAVRIGSIGKQREGLSWFQR